MKSSKIRQEFLNYFKSKGHAVVPSSSLIPSNDPTLLFTNAGMVPFKEMFLGQETRDYTRATSAQRCIRAGGKHNDLENVGYTARHHTFFEMLGNFSFGDYFKSEAISFCWEFITEVLKIPKEKLWVSVYEEDQETADIWVKEIGFDPKRISFCGEKDNFWTMGDTGPCGPCSEIFYDHGEDIAGGPPGTPEEDGDRFIEIWNLVFTQYDRAKDGTLTELPKPSVDTGMGLERLSALLQGVHNNYETDVFMPIIESAARLCGQKDLKNTSLRVIADHIRSTSFLISDGVMPSNEGRGYVLRRIIRRAIRHGHKLGMPKPFFYQLVQALVDVMGEAYPEIKKAQSKIEVALKKEEEQFLQTLEQGLKILEKTIKELKGKEIPGDVVFKLYDTYGFPADLTADYARECNYCIDEAGFCECMEEQKNRSRKASKFSVDYSQEGEIAKSLEGVESEFVGYDQDAVEAKVLLLLKEGKVVDALTAGEQGIIVLDKTPFYGEAGGQVGDSGDLSSADAKFEIADCQKINNIVLHYGEVKQGEIKVNDKLNARIDSSKRLSIRANHSAAHIMHLMLQRVLGEHVEQKGSYVAADRLRLDISHAQPVSKEEIWQVEQMVNAEICANHEAITDVMTPDEAKAQGAMALFGEKYGNKVRVLRLGDSFELCGGTHVARTGDIGLFKIIYETGIAAGIRRIEAVTGKYALDYMHELNLKHLHDEHELQSKLRDREKTIEKLKQKIASQQGGELANKAKEINGVKVLAEIIEGVDPKALRQMVEELKNKLQSAIVVLATQNKGKASVVAGVTKDLIKQYKAGDIVNHVAAFVGGKGGGKPEMAQAGGDQPENLLKAIESVVDFIA